MDAVFNVTLPVFAIIAVGILSGRTGLLGQSSTDALNRFVYFIALPAVLFLGMASRPLAEILNGPFIGAFLGAMLIIFAVGMALAPLFGGRSLPVAVMQGLNASFSNTGYMGIPLFLAAFGPDRLSPAILATVIMGAVMVGLAVVLLEGAIHASAGPGAAVRKVLGALIRNPLILSPAAGLLVSATGFPLPTPVATFCELLGAAAGPCALFAIGLFMASRPLRLGGIDMVPLVGLKLLAHPALTWVFATSVFGLEGEWLTGAVLLAALPTGALTFVVAQQYQVYVERTSTAILASTLLSLVTLSVLLAVWGAAG